MTREIYRKILSANDVGSTGGHQAGILVPKTNKELLAFLPYLDPAVKNPDKWLICLDEEGNERKFRFIYYNNKLHEKKGTRNEFRITHMTTYFRSVGAKQGDIFEISKAPNSGQFLIGLIKQASDSFDINNSDSPVRIKIKSTWRRIH